MNDLCSKLSEYTKSDAYPFHMPGHKRNMEGYQFADAFSVDITEINDFDNLHDARGILKQTERKIAGLYGSEETHMLVNGSTCGILAAVAGTVGRGNKLLLARNSHKAVYNALFLNELKGVFLYPELAEEFGICGAVSPESVEQALQDNPDSKAVFLTSPTYDGIISDIRSIAAIVHKYKIPLIVDEAHGAHFGMYEPFLTKYNMRSSVECGADIVIHSLHKTLPSFTQTAVIHLNGDLIDREKIRQYLRIYQTSSPSYLFMAGMEQCISIVEKEGSGRFKALENNLSELELELCSMKNLKLVSWNSLSKTGIYGFDPCKILISTKMTDVSGAWLSEELRSRYKIEMEMAAGSYALGIATIMDKREGFKRLSQACLEIDHRLSKRKEPEGKFILPVNEKIYEIYEAFSYEKEYRCFTQCEGETAGGSIYAYPPGIPIIAPGEKITKEVIHSVGEMERQGIYVVGIEEGKFAIKKRS